MLETAYELAFLDEEAVGRITITTTLYSLHLHYTYHFITFNI